MKIENLNTCINCKNLMRDFICSKHNQGVGITNTCESHVYQNSITKNSSCLNCFHFGKISCSNAEESSPTMFCFDWKIK